MRQVRPSLRRISTLDTIEELSSDSINASRRNSKAFSVNMPVNSRPQRGRMSLGTSIAAAALETSAPDPNSGYSSTVAKPRALEPHISQRNSQRNSLTRRVSTARCSRNSLCTELPAPKPQKRPRLGSADSDKENLPSYARPTKASMAKVHQRASSRK